MYMYTTCACSLLKHVYRLLIGTSRTDFKPQLDHMNRDMTTVIAWDPPGYGKSTPKRTWPDHWFERDAQFAATFMAVSGLELLPLVGQHCSTL